MSLFNTNISNYKANIELMKLRSIYFYNKKEFYLRIKKGYLLNYKYPILVEMQGIEPWSKQGIRKFSTCLVSN